MKPEISIILPAIRPDRWDAVYDSILGATTRTFELIIVSPYPLTPKLQNLVHVKYVKDYGSPMRASNIGAMLCEGKYVTWIADDCLLQKDSLDNNLKQLEAMGQGNKNVIVTKYFEGKNGTDKPLQNDDYFKINGSTWTSSPYIPNEWWIFNVAIMYRDFFEELGAWDCTYQACPLGHTDLAIRAQMMGARVQMSQYPLLDCDHMPGSSGDHGPIEIAQTYEDAPAYRYRFRDNKLDQINPIIKITNWKNSPSVWERRFRTYAN